MREIKHHGLDLSIGRYSSGHSADLYHHRGFRHSRLRPPNLYPCSITETRSIDRQRSDGNWMGNAQLKADLSAACPNACISAAALQRPGFDSRREQRFRKNLNKLWRRVLLLSASLLKRRGFTDLHRTIQAAHDRWSRRAGVKFSGAEIATDLIFVPT